MGRKDNGIQRFRSVGEPTAVTGSVLALAVAAYNDEQPDAQ